MLIIFFVSIILSSENLREIIENIFASLAVKFQMHLEILSLLLFLLSSACIVIYSWPSLPKHFIVTISVVFAWVFCFLSWNQPQVLHFLFFKKGDMIYDDINIKQSIFPSSIFSSLSSSFYVFLFIGLFSFIGILLRPSFDIPCPPGFPLFGHAFFFLKTWKKGTGNALVDVLNYYRSSYGNIYLTYLGMSPMVIVSDPELFKQILSLKHKNFIKSKQAYSSFKPILGGGLVTLEGDLWKLHRNLISPCFNYKYLQDTSFKIFLEVILKHKEKFILVQGKKKTIEVVDAFRKMTLEIIAKAALNIESSDILMALEELYSNVVSEMNLRFWYPYRGWFPTKEDKKYRLQLQKLDELIMQVILSRQQEFNRLEKQEQPFPTRDLLDLMISGKDENNKTLSNEDLLCEIKTFLIAGHETTAMWLAYTFHHLVQPENKNSYNKVKEESLDIMKKGKNDLQVEDLAKLTFTTNCLKETLRCLPVVSVLMREVLHEVEIGNHLIPKGCKVVLDIWGSHHNKKEWGNDTEDFRPERFDEKQHPFAFLPFSLGPRNCLGQNFAYMEAKMVIALFFSSFDFSCPQAGSLPMFKYDIPLHPIEGIPLIIQ